MKRLTAIMTLALLACASLMASNALEVSRAVLSAAADDPLVINREFRVSMGQRLEFDLDTGGGIEVTGWDNEMVSVEVYKGGSDGADSRVDFQQTASGIRITSEYVGKRHSYNTDIRFTVRVPRRFDLDFNSMGGSLSVCGVEGRIGGRTMGGSLHLNNLKGDVNLETMGGSITLTNSEVNGKVGTMGGRVLIENVLGDVRGSTMGGEVVRRNNGNGAGRSAGTECAPTRRRNR